MSDIYNCCFQKSEDLIEHTQNFVNYRGEVVHFSITLRNILGTNYIYSLYKEILIIKLLAVHVRC